MRLAWDWGYFVVNRPSGSAGLVTLDSIRKVPRSDWPVTTAARVMVPLQDLDSMRPDAVLWATLEKMGHDRVNQLPVIEGNGTVGILTREDVVHYLHVLHAFACRPGIREHAESRRWRVV